MHFMADGVGARMRGAIELPSKNSKSSQGHLSNRLDPVELLVTAISPANAVP